MPLVVAPMDVMINAMFVRKRTSLLTAAIKDVWCFHLAVARGDALLIGLY